MCVCVSVGACLCRCVSVCLCVRVSACVIVFAHQFVVVTPFIPFHDALDLAQRRTRRKKDDSVGGTPTAAPLESHAPLRYVRRRGRECAERDGRHCERARVRIRDRGAVVAAAAAAALLPYSTG
jgi:hypothetical protein